jgi:hypothetical protein
MTDWNAVERNVRRAIAHFQNDSAIRHGSDFRPAPAALVIPETIKLQKSDAPEAESTPETILALC